MTTLYPAFVSCLVGRRGEKPPLTRLGQQISHNVNIKDVTHNRPFSGTDAYLLLAMFILPSVTLYNSRYVPWEKGTAVIRATYAFALDLDIAGWATLWYLGKEKLIVSGLPVNLFKRYG